MTPGASPQSLTFRERSVGVPRRSKVFDNLSHYVINSGVASGESKSGAETPSVSPGVAPRKLSKPGLRGPVKSASGEVSGRL